MFGLWLHTATWKAVRVIFIPKQGRDSYELAKSLRPISLTSFFLKTIERLVDAYKRAVPLKSFPLKESQNAYHQKGRSTRILDFSVLN
jgi:hypothetical protein